MQAAARFSGNFAKIIANTHKGRRDSGGQPYVLLQKDKERQRSGLQLPSWSEHGKKVRTMPHRELGRLEGEMLGNTGPSAARVQWIAGQACAGDLSSLLASLCCLPGYDSDLLRLTTILNAVPQETCRCEMVAVTSQNKAQTSLKLSQRGNSVSVQPEEEGGKNPTAVLGGEVGIVYPFLKDK